MAGNPLKAPSDASKFRQQYMATLALQANINDANLQANKIYKRTGQTPTQPTDMRLTSEKLADIARLRIEVRAQLGSIMDGQDANDVSTNLSPDSLQFVAQNINPIVKDVKEKYKLGIPAAVFENYINSYMVKSSQVNEVAYGLQQQANPIIGAQQISGIIDRGELDILSDLLDNGVVNRYLSRALDKTIRTLYEVLPLEDYLTTIGEIDDVELRSLVQKDLDLIFNTLPRKDVFNAKLENLKRFVNRNDVKMADQYADEIRQLISLEPSDIQKARQIYDIIQQTKYKKGTYDPFSILETERQTPDKGGGEGEPKKRPRVEGDPVLARIDEAQTRIRRDYPQVDLYSNTLELALSNLSNKEKSIVLRDIVTAITGEKNMSLASYMVGLGHPRPKGQLNRADYQVVIDGIMKDLPVLLRGSFTRDIDYSTAKPSPPPPSFSNEPTSVKQGKGLRKGRSPIIPEIDYSQGVLPTTIYIPFGKIFLDKDKLTSGIVSARKGKGACFHTIKSRRVSPNLTDIIKSISGGGSPTFSQLSKLDEDERRYLYELGKKSSLLDRIDLPAPTKEDDDKDINQFEIMKGEIVSGNDSVELVKKFKALIVKMIAKGLLPKAQGKDMLLGLVELGY
jgi:hypothetical protein